MSQNIATLKALGAPSTIVNTAARIKRSVEAAAKANAKAFDSQLKAAEDLAKLREWYDATKAARKKGAEDGAVALPKWYDFAEQVAGVKKAFAARLLQVADLIAGGADVDAYKAAEAAECEGSEPRAALLRFIKWAKEGTLETPPAEVEETAEEVAEGAAEDAAEDTPADGVVRVRAEGCAVDFDPETGEFTLNGPRAAEVLDALLGAWAAAQA